MNMLTSSLENSFRSIGLYCAKPSAAIVRGMMDTLSSASVVGSIQPMSAWPHS